MVIKVQVLMQCEACDGAGYLPTGEATSYSGERYLRYEPCAVCQGTGRQTRWISLDEFANLVIGAAFTTIQPNQEVIQPILSQR